MLALGPYAQLMLIVAGFWLFVISLALACISAGAIGGWIGRRRGRNCLYCPYQGTQMEVVEHYALEHEQERGNGHQRRADHRNPAGLG